MSKTKLVDQVLRKAVETKEVPGVMAMAATDKGVIYEGAFGKRELGKDASMTLDSVVWIASMTKAITATAAMQLMERGKIKLEQNAGEAGLANTFFWIDPTKKITGVFLTQILPFFDPKAIKVFNDFESAVYQSL
jgi:CubicO group peptidase (beta-lactamase class C family)